jgi:O-antigen/teichoic acid export membrane protein
MAIGLTQPTNAPRLPKETDGLRSATRIGRNFTFRLGAQVLSALINVGGMVLLGNHLAAEGYGEYAFYYALIPLIASLSDLGVGVITTREIARHRDRGALYLGDALILKGTVSAFLLLAVGLTSWRLMDPGHAALVCITAATALIDFSQDVSVWVFRAHERLDLEAILLLTSQVVWLGVLVGALSLHAPLAGLLGAATVAFVVRASLGAIVVARRMYRPQFAPTWARLRALVLQGLPFSLAMFGVVLYSRIGVLMLKAFANSTDVAYFNVAYMLSQPLGFISSALSVAAFPALSRQAQRGDSAISRALVRTTKYQLMITMPVMVGLFLLAQRLVPMLLHGGNYGQAGVALKVMSLGLTFVFLNLMARYILTAIDRQRHYLNAVLLGLATNAALCAVLIPRWRFLGACVAWVGAEAAIFTVCQMALSRYVSLGETIRQGQKPLLAALAMGVAVFFVRGWNIFAVAGLGAVLYAAALFVLGGFSSEELRIVRGVYVSFRLPGSGYLKRVEDRS